MITSLHIKNIGIIDEINIDFGKGFNVLTGETGARKNTYNRFASNSGRRKIFKRDDTYRRRVFFC